MNHDEKRAITEKEKDLLVDVMKDLFAIVQKHSQHLSPTEFYSVLGLALGEFIKHSSVIENHNAIAEAICYNLNQSVRQGKN